MLLLAQICCTLYIACIVRVCVVGRKPNKLIASKKKA